MGFNSGFKGLIATTSLSHCKGPLSAGHRLLGVSFIVSPKSNLYTALTTQKITVLSHTHKTRLHFIPLYF